MFRVLGLLQFLWVFTTENAFLQLRIFGPQNLDQPPDAKHRLARHGSQHAPAAATPDGPMKRTLCDIELGKALLGMAHMRR